MRARRGFALLVALWLVVAITAVGLQFALEAREHRLLALGTSERGTARAAATGSLALTQARLERALRQPTVSGAAAQALRAGDPWLDADSLFSTIDTLGGVVVEVRARDLGERLNLNQLGEEELRTFFGFVFDDYMLADQLAQSVLDWRDRDDLARSRGAEREQYERQGRLALPTNTAFREVDELLHVQGMTPERFARVQGYLTTRGSGRVNVNAADEPVLRALPGMTDEAVARVLGWRSQGRRVRALAEVLPTGARTAPGPQPRRPTPPPRQPGQPAGPGGAGNELLRRLEQRATVDTRELELTLVARAGPQALPLRVQVGVQRSGTSATVAWRSWQ